jgi:acetyl-CoA carboxylase biotin carboxyl carrier protein
MNQKEIKELIEFLVEKDIAEFSLERGDMKVHIKRGAGAAALPKGLVPQAAGPAGPASADGPSVAAPAAPPPSASATGAAAEENLFIVKSPIVGTFYEAPSPGAPPFVKVGDAVSEGQVLCLIEAMKLMNEIEAEVSGEIAKQFVSNGSPVEYGMPLFGIRRT